jgi:hypothetical protein
MPRYLLIAGFLVYAMVFSTSLFGNTNKDTTSLDKNYSIGVLPAIAFDSDLGFQYGVLANLYLHSKTNPYPNYGNSFYIEASQYTAGSSMLRFFIDSKTLTKPFRTNFDCTYIRDLTNDFFGFNGAATIFNAQFEDETSNDYVSRVFYKYNTEMFRLMGNINGKIGQGNCYWVAGFSAINYNTQDVDVDKLNKQHPNDPLPTGEQGLFEKYKEWALITPSEAKGGFNAQIRAGVGIDTRDFESNPTSGIWSEVLFSTIPNWASSHNYGNLQITAVHRQYLSLANKNTILAYRVLANYTPIGQTPYYLLSNIPTSWLTGARSEGLGGAKTLRGIRRNRIIGEGIALANVEVRQKLTSFRWKNQDFYIATNLFTDAGKVIQNYDIDLTHVPESEQQTYFTGTNDKLHLSYGLGLKFAANENFIISADYGLTSNEQDGKSGLYIDLNYLF